MTQQPSKKLRGVGRPKELENQKRIILIIESADLELIKELALFRRISVQSVIRQYIKEGLASEATA